MIQFENIKKVYPDGNCALDVASLEIPQGQFCVILGSSGAGKSTLLRLVNGMIEPTEGVVRFEKFPVIRKNLKKIQPRISMIHQQFNLVGRLSVMDNVLCGTLPRIPTLHAILKLFPTSHKRKACELLEQVGLGEEYLYRRAMHLSGGQQQRVAIARAFILSPDLVLADEPVASLDPKISHDILTLLRQASHRYRATVLCSLHQVELATQFADRIVGMKYGNVLFDGTPRELSESVLKEIYGSIPDGHKQQTGQEEKETRGTHTTQEVKARM